ncbi:MAG TPA: hypothetical protein VMR00_03280 [Streptosporangiaceae bacterium]|jgi:hypothetical protein|nr:hypothetical protein [Streptosporangiaceae bacterium]
MALASDVAAGNGSGQRWGAARVKRSRKELSVTVALAAVIGGLVIVLLAVGIPYWLTHQRMSAQDDRAESAAYLEATGRTAEDVAAGRSGQPLQTEQEPARRWRQTAGNAVAIPDEPDDAAAGGSAASTSAGETSGGSAGQTAETSARTGGDSAR